MYFAVKFPPWSPKSCSPKQAHEHKHACTHTHTLTSSSRTCQFFITAPCQQEKTLHKILLCSLTSCIFLSRWLTDNGSPQWQGKGWSDVTEVSSRERKTEIITWRYLLRIKWLQYAVAKLGTGLINLVNSFSPSTPVWTLPLFALSCSHLSTCSQHIYLLLPSAASVVKYCLWTLPFLTCPGQGSSDLSLAFLYTTLV